jgi:hypothetical protein
MGHKPHSALTTPEGLQTICGRVGGSPLAALLVDNVTIVANDGQPWPEVLREAVTRTVKEYALRGTRAIEEHYCREADGGQGLSFRDRIETALRQVDVVKLADHALRAGSAPARERKQKMTGIDDGPRL